MSRLYDQYLEAKATNRGRIVLFQMGDFFEAFDKDAAILHELGLILRERDFGPERLRMVGMPSYHLEECIAKLVELGHLVTVFKQVGTRSIDGVIPREVTYVG